MTDDFPRENALDDPDCQEESDDLPPMVEGNDDTEGEEDGTA